MDQALTVIWLLLTVMILHRTRSAIFHEFKLNTPEGHFTGMIYIVAGVIVATLAVLLIYLFIGTAIFALGIDYDNSFFNNKP